MNLNSAEDATAARHAYAEPIWERYRQQAMEGRDGALRELRDRLLTGASADEQMALAHREAVNGVAWGIIVLQRLVDLFGAETTGKDLDTRYRAAQRSEEIGTEWIVGGSVDGVYLHLSPPEATPYLGDLTKANFSIDAGETLRQAMDARQRERSRFQEAEHEMSRRADERRCHAALIGVLVEEYELEGQVLPWFIREKGSSGEREKQATRAAWALIDYREKHEGKYPDEDAPGVGIPFGGKDGFYRYVADNSGAERRGGKDGGKGLGRKILKAVGLWKRGTPGKSEGLMEMALALEAFGRRHGRPNER